MHKLAFAFWVYIMILIPLAAWAGEEASPLRFYDQELKAFIDAPGIATEIRTDVDGVIAKTHVVQYFYNNTDQWQEGVYTYPLPEDASVDRLVMVVDDRRILGFVAEKEKAKKIYETAKQEGKAAGLVEQHRPNIFKTSVANIPPKSLIAIEIGYQHEASIDERTLSLRVPMAITPRFDMFDVKDLLTLAAAESGEAQKGPLARELAERIALFDFEDGHNPVHIEFNVDAGFKPDFIASPSHKVQVNSSGEGRFHVSPRENILPGEQDFVLSWDLPKSSTQNVLSFMHEERLEGNVYTHLMILPPVQQSLLDSAPKRQVSLIIDTSGSMSGPSIRQAKAALREAVYDLNADDLFNVIEFNSDTKALFDRSLPASPENIKTALRWIEQLEAEGGTVMFPSVEMALGEAVQDGYLRQVVFMTDGAIGYESDLGDYIASHVGEARFYAVGIGAAPNSHLMQMMAESGRGTFTYISDIDETQKKMGALFKKMKSPVVTDLSLDIRGAGTLEMTPTVLPDLMTGEPVSVVIRSKRAIKSARLNGQQISGGQPKSWSQDVTLAPQTNAEGISRLYARKKIGEIMASRSGLTSEQKQAQVTSLGVQHQILSAYTSFVAVDEKIIRPKNATLLAKRYNPNLPKGWQLAEYDPRDAARAYDDYLKEHDGQSPENELKRKINLPQTADGYMVRLVTGLVLMMLAAALMMYEAMAGNTLRRKARRDARSSVV